jgi:hypothetical protein
METTRYQASSSPAPAFVAGPHPPHAGPPLGPSHLRLWFQPSRVQRDPAWFEPNHAWTRPVVRFQALGGLFSPLPLPVLPVPYAYDRLTTGFQVRTSSDLDHSAVLPWVLPWDPTAGSSPGIQPKAYDRLPTGFLVRTPSEPGSLGRTSLKCPPSRPGKHGRDRSRRTPRDSNLTTGFTTGFQVRTWSEPGSLGRTSLECWS